MEELPRGKKIPQHIAIFPRGASGKNSAASYKINPNTLF